MAYTSINITTDLNYISASNYLQGNELTGIFSNELVAKGFLIVSDVPGDEATPRTIKLSFGGCPYLVQLDCITGVHNRISIMGLDTTTLINSWNSGHTSTGNDTALKGGTIQILLGPNAIVVKVTTLNSATALPTFFGYLKFDDGLWYAWSHLLGSTGNGGILDNISNVPTIAAAGIYYPNFVNGAYPLVPWMIAVGTTVWNVSPLGCYSIKPTNFTDKMFYVDPDMNNYFHFGTAMITDL